MKEREPRTSSRSVADLFLILLAFLIPLDVGVRRIQPDLYVIKGWFGLARGKSPSGTTLAALLHRKEEITFVPERAPGEGPLPSVPARAAGTRRKAVPETPDVRRGKDADEKDLSTTGRLLAKKRKWRKEE